MAKYTEKDIAERYQKLPEALKDAMYSADIATKMVEIGKKFGLTIEETGFVAEETGYVVLGLMRPSELASALENRLKVDSEKARAIAQEISRQVFYPIREALKAAHEFAVSDEAMEKPLVSPRKVTAEVQRAPVSPAPPAAERRVTEAAEEKATLTPKEMKKEVKPEEIKPEREVRIPREVQPEVMRGAIFAPPEGVALPPRPTPPPAPAQDRYREEIRAADAAAPPRPPTRQEIPPPRPAPIPPAPPLPQSKIPPIDLRAQATRPAEVTKPSEEKRPSTLRSTSDPYREPIE